MNIKAQSTTLDFPTIDVPSKGKDHAKYSHDPFCLAFLYHPKGRILLKGWATEVEDYINKNFQIYIVNKVYLNSGQLINYGYKPIPVNGNRNFWTFDVCGQRICIDEPCGGSPSYRRRNYCFYTFINNEKIELLKLRRIPKKWIPEYNKMVKLILGIGLPY